MELIANRNFDTLHDGSHKKNEAFTVSSSTGNGLIACGNARLASDEAPEKKADKGAEYRETKDDKQHYGKRNKGKHGK